MSLIVISNFLYELILRRQKKESSNLLEEEGFHPISVFAYSIMAMGLIRNDKFRKCAEKLNRIIIYIYVSIN